MNIIVTENTQIKLGTQVLIIYDR